MGKFMDMVSARPPIFRIKLPLGGISARTITPVCVRVGCGGWDSNCASVDPRLQAWQGFYYVVAFSTGLFAPSALTTAAPTTQTPRPVFPAPWELELFT